MSELLFEIGMEEMPARFVRPALEQLARLAETGLVEARLGFEAVAVHGTPRRLALVASGLADRQEDFEEVQLGPPVKAAFDAEGQPTKAALGFAKSQGVAVGELQELDSEKGPRLGVVRQIQGRPAIEVLAELLPQLVERLSFPKTMRWGAVGFRFARPIHWFVALLDGEVIPFTLAGITSGNQTMGHRFMVPVPIKVSGGADYLSKLSEAHVVADRQERRTLVSMEVDTTAQMNGGRLVPDPELLEEVTDLVEQPVACCGEFDPEFLAVPRAVIISAMRSHQRYFALEDADGKLLNKFIAVNNTSPRQLKLVTAGHERVLRARLADARFFLDEDLKRPLIDRLEDLSQVTYHAKLGTSREKVERFTALAGILADRLCPNERAIAVRGAELAKCDLVTEMVGEFPDLQGVVGEEYALRTGEEAAAARVVREHYLPVGADAELPASLPGCCVALADRMDTICGFIGVGMPPSGAADPYALRRAAIGFVRIVSEKRLRLSLDETIAAALDGLTAWLTLPAEEVALQVRDFFAARLSALLADQGVPTDVATAVIAAGLDDLTATVARARALAEVKDSPEFQPLAVGMKRVMNILRKEADQVPAAPPQEGLLEEGAEEELYRQFQALRTEAEARFTSGDYRGFLHGLSALKGPIDQFFDDVLVMAPDQAVRANRLAMLGEIAGLFRQVAEFTHLQLA